MRGGCYPYQPPIYNDLGSVNHSFRLLFRGVAGLAFSHHQYYHFLNALFPFPLTHTHCLHWAPQGLKVFELRSPKKITCIDAQPGFYRLTHALQTAPHGCMNLSGSNRQPRMFRASSRQKWGSKRRYHERKKIHTSLLRQDRKQLLDSGLQPRLSRQCVSPGSGYSLTHCVLHQAMLRTLGRIMRRILRELHSNHIWQMYLFRDTSRRRTCILATSPLRLLSL